jgi:hypothetical protein
VAISNGRLLELNDGQVTFSYKDYAANSEIKTMTLKTEEFARRFLLHVLPRGFVRIRYYGFLANCCRTEKLALCRRLLSEGKSEPTSGAAPSQHELQSDSTLVPTICPHCRKGNMIIIEKISVEKCMELSLISPVPAANTS